MQGCFAAFHLPSGLPYLFLFLDLISINIAVPMISDDPRLPLISPYPRNSSNGYVRRGFGISSFTELHVSCRSNLGKGWLDPPFAIPIKALGPNDHCHLFFPTVGRSGTSAEGHYFLLHVLEEMVSLKASPPDSIPNPCDISRFDVRFQMKIISQSPMSVGMALESLEIIYGIVVESEVREFVALVVCQGLAMGRFRAWLLDSVEESRALQ